jgi:hypothetical protein
MFIVINKSGKRLGYRKKRCVLLTGMGMQAKTFIFYAAVIIISQNFRCDFISVTVTERIVAQHWDILHDCTLTLDGGCLKCPAALDP